jgi:hypothetical protein
VEAVRATLARLFDRFVLHRADSRHAPTRLHAELGFIDGYVTEPVIRDEPDGSLLPSAREPLGQAGEVNTKNDRRPTGYQYLFGPILVGESR